MVFYYIVYWSVRELELVKKVITITTNKREYKCRIKKY